MSKPLTSRLKADKISLAVFLVGLAILSYIDSWWPGLALVLGASLITKRLFEGKYYDAVLALVVFGGAFAAIQYNVSWMTVIFLIAALFVLFRAFLNTSEDEIEEEEEVQKEIEEEKK